MKRIISVIIISAMLLSLIPLVSLANEGIEWPDVPAYPIPLRRMPDNNWYSNQNPPSFLWNFVSDASLYEIVVSEDKELKKIKYKGETDKNMYNFPCVFETGKEYWWSVRFKTASGVYSKWNEPFRFVIDEDACEFPVSPVDEVANVLIKEHPRMLFTKSSLEDAKKNLNRENESFRSFKAFVEDLMISSLPEKPRFYSEEELKGGSTTNFWYQPTRDLGNVALMYLLTDEERYLKRAVAMLENLFDWSPEEAFGWNQYTDTAEGIFSMNVAVVYDWLYDKLTAEQRKKCVQLIERNIVRPYADFADGGNINGSLYYEPYNSHAWQLTGCALAALSIYEESEIAREIADFHLPIMLSLWEPYRYQSGASSQGPFYGNGYDEVCKMLLFSTLGIADLRNSSLFRNQTEWYLYLWTTNWMNNVGDAYNGKPSETYQHLIADSAFAYIYSDSNIGETSKWMLKRSNAGKEDTYISKEFLTTIYNLNDAKPTIPVKRANDKLFYDVGWAGMYSDISDDYRVGMTFKSSFYGSYNHSHPDQNSFVIQAYGEPLAIDSGYYDYYKSTFDLEYNRKTYAHNAITYDEGMGQTPFSDASKGKVTGFLGSNKFAYVAGDAKKAYGGNLTKAEREIIYIKPDVFIVVDDLETKSKSSTFEYWLNTLGEIKVFENKNGAVISKGEAAMDVNIHYPEKVEANYINIFAGPELSEVAVPSMALGSTDKRISFSTKPLKATKMVSTLSVRRGQENPGAIESKNYGNYIKLLFEEGVAAYINLTDGEVQTKDGFSFDGSSFVYDKEGYVLTNGKKLTADGVVLLSSDVEISATVTKESVSVSSLEKDANIKLLHKNITGLKQHFEDRFRKIDEKKKTHGIYWEKTDDGITLNIYPGSYTLYNENFNEPGRKAEGIFTLEIDGVKKEIPFKGVYNMKGELLYDYYPENTGVYKIVDYSDVSIMNTKENSLFLLSPNNCIMTKGEQAYLKLESVSASETGLETIDNPDKLKEKAYEIKYADEFDEVSGTINFKHWSSTGKYTLQGLNSSLEYVLYNFNVKEAGYYDIVMSASTVSKASPTRMFEIGNKQGIFILPPTEVYSELKGTRIKTKVYLEKGENTVKLYAIENGEWIIDWVGIAESEVDN